jgi:hypothetical protein
MRFRSHEQYAQNEMSWTGQMANMGEKRYVHRVLESEGRRPLGRSRRRCEGNIKINFTEIALSGMDWIILRIQEIVEIFCTHNNKHWISKNDGKSC